MSRLLELVLLMIRHCPSVPIALPGVRISRTFKVTCVERNLPLRKMIVNDTVFRAKPRFSRSPGHRPPLDERGRSTFPDEPTAGAIVPKTAIIPLKYL